MSLDRNVKIYLNMIWGILVSHPQLNIRTCISILPSDIELTAFYSDYLIKYTSWVNISWNLPRNHQMINLNQKCSLYKHNSYVDDRNHFKILVLSRRFIPNNTNKWFMKFQNRISKNPLKFCFVCDFCFVYKQIFDKKITE